MQRRQPVPNQWVSREWIHIQNQRESCKLQMDIMEALKNSNFNFNNPYVRQLLRIQLDRSRYYAIDRSYAFVNITNEQYLKNNK